MGNLEELSQSPELLVRGSLRQTPLAEFLIQAYDSGLDGTLLLQTQEREKSAILFIRGAPAKARPARNAIYLGDVVTELGLVEKSLSRSTRERADKEQRTHGSVLRELGYLDESSLYVALREQLFRQVLVLADLPDTTGFGFYRANYLADWGDKGQWRVKPLPMIWRALVDHIPDTRREAWLRRLGDTPLQMRREAPVSRYHLSTDEKNVLDVLRAKAMSVSNLMHAGVGTPDLVRRVACALLLSRQIEVGAAKEPVGLHEPPETSQSVLPPENKGSKRTTPRPGRLPAVSLPPGFSTAPRGESLPPGVSLPPGAPMVSGRSSPTAKGRSSMTSSDVSSPDESSVAPRSTSSPGRSLTPEPASRRTGPGRSADTHPPGGGSLRPPAGSHRPPEGVEAIRAEIEAYRERRVDNHYEVLGVERKADAATIRSAFFQLAKRWHPDRLPSELSDIKPFVTKAFAAMGEAHQTLLDESKRAEYDRTLGQHPEGDEQAQVVAILDAASAFQRAEILLKKKDLKGAFQQAKLAYEGDPTQADHAALYAWVQGQQRSEGFDDLIKMLDAAIKADGANIRAFWYRGQLYKKAGEEQKAIRDFKKIIQLKPNHVDAQRELRVYSMRKRSDPNAGGLFGRFKKKE